MQHSVESCSGAPISRRRLPAALHRRIAPIWWRHEVPFLMRDWVCQWAWFLTGARLEETGYGPGPLTLVRSIGHRLRRKPLRLVLLEEARPRHRYGGLWAFAINRGSRVFSVRRNGGLRRADVVWICAQDPLDPAQHARMTQRIAAQVRPGTPVVNTPAAYNAYHAADCFPRLAAAGVTVPRSRYGRSDVGRALVVYKRIGGQGLEKTLELYKGPRPGYRTFEFIESRDPAGVRRRYRAHHIAGLIRPAEVMLSTHWSVRGETATMVDYSFDLSPEERRQIALIARTLSLEFFAVDFVRREADGTAYFIDINVYPNVRSPRWRVHARGDNGSWHTFDARARLAIPEPDGAPFWQSFDSAMLDFVRQSGGHRP
jgi:hypothetical protein